MTDEYFSSYGDLEVHRIMLTDHHRVEAYKSAIFSNEDLFKDKSVLDVGSGTGILSIFCAQAGAKKVYAVEASSLADLCKRVVEKNNFSDIVEVLNTKVEDVVLPGDEKVDIIVSEWMGFYLLHEGMLDSVIVARDKHLKPGGKMFPETASLYSCPCSVSGLFGYWENVEGVNMCEFGDELRKLKGDKPVIMEVNSEDLLSQAVCMLQLDLNKVQVIDLDKFSSRHVVCCKRDGLYQGLCLWFSCQFPSKSRDNCLVLDTSPSHPLTHWKQTVVVLPNQYPVEVSEPIAWELMLMRSLENPRHYNIQFTMLDHEKEIHPIPCDCYMTKCIVTRTFLECEEEPDNIIDMT